MESSADPDNLFYSLFIVAFIVCGSFVFSPCFVIK